MADRVFYPLVILIALGAIAAALAPGMGREQAPTAQSVSEETAMVVRGRALNSLNAGEGVGFETLSEDDGPLFVQARASKAADAPPLSAGLFATVPEARESHYAGKALRVSVLARARGREPVDRFQMGYFTADGRPDSGWRDFEPGFEFETFSFTFTPDPMTGEPNLDYVGIWPDADGENGALQIAQISVEPVNEPDEAQ